MVNKRLRGVFMQPKKATWREELSALADNGKLRAQDVVGWARENPDSQLHAHFEWDEGKAAHQYRLEQARRLIRVYVNVVPTESGPVEMRAFFSLPSDRVQPGGGYRRAEDVLRNRKWLKQLAEDFVRQHERVNRNFEFFRELFPKMIEETERVAERIRRGSVKRRRE